MAAPEVEAAIRNAAAMQAGQVPDPADVQLAAYGAEAPNLRQTVGPSYDEYMRWSNRSPAWGGQGNLPVYPDNGYHYTPLSMREAYEEHNIPPVMYNRGGFTGAAYRTYVNPFGQMMVQPLVGAASKYPHVLSGVPMDMNYGFNWAMSDVPMWMPWLWNMRGPQAPAPQGAAPRPAAPVAGNTMSANPPPAATQPLTFPDLPVRAPQPGYGDPYQSDAQAGRKAMRPVIQQVLQAVAPPPVAQDYTMPIEDDGVQAMAEDLGLGSLIWNGVVKPAWNWAAANSPNNPPVPAAVPQVAPPAQPLPMPQMTQTPMPSYIDPKYLAR